MATNFLFFLFSSFFDLKFGFLFLGEAESCLLLYKCC